CAHLPATVVLTPPSAMVVLTPPY
ncbi:hypothetical protein A2U01_0061040, partial [Trifolium medium]|nr:hypothetical protein [Trifolium medium]